MIKRILKTGSLSLIMIAVPSLAAAQTQTAAEAKVTEAVKILDEIADFKKLWQTIETDIQGSNKKEELKKLFLEISKTRTASTTPKTELKR